TLAGGNYTGSGSCVVSTANATSQSSSVTATYGGDSHAYPGGTSVASTLYINPKLAFSSTAFSQNAGSCNGITVQFRDADDSSRTVSAATVVALSTSSAGGAF